MILELNEFDGSPLFQVFLVSAGLCFLVGLIILSMDYLGRGALITFLSIPLFVVGVSMAADQESKEIEHYKAEKIRVLEDSGLSNVEIVGDKAVGSRDGQFVECELGEVSKTRYMVVCSE